MRAAGASSRFANSCEHVRSDSIRQSPECRPRKPRQVPCNAAGEMGNFFLRDESVTAPCCLSFTLHLQGQPAAIHRDDSA
jgi:hypothetical protein